MMSLNIKSIVVGALLAVCSFTNSNKLFALDAPVLNSFSFVWVNTLSLSWDPVEGATGYKVFVSETYNFDQNLPMYNGQIVSNNNIGVLNLVPETTYFVRVKAVNNTEESGYSNIIDATTNAANIEAPAVYTPTNVNGGGFTLSWSSISGTQPVYQVLVSEDNFESIVPGLPWFTDLTSLTITGLKPYTEYKYKVKAKDFQGTDESTYSAVSTVSTSWGASEATTVGVNGFIANWATYPGVSIYRLFVSTDNFATHIPGYNGAYITNDNFYAFKYLDHNTQYQYRLKANVGGTWSDFSNAVEVTTIEPTASAPTLHPPSDVSHSSFKASWNSLGGGINFYKLYVSENDFVTHVDGFGGDNLIPNTEVIVSGLNPETNYKFRVKVVGQIGESTFSPSQTVSTLELPDPPSTPVALEATEVTTTGFNANWEESAGADGYKLFVSIDDFSSYLDDYNGLAIAGLSQSVGGLSPNTTYKYKLVAFNSTNESDFSNIISVSTIDNTTAISNNSENKIIIYPNPATDYLKIEGAEKANKVEIIQIDGKPIMQLLNVDLQNVPTINISHLSNGIYVIRIKIDNQVVVRKLLLNK